MKEPGGHEESTGLHISAVPGPSLLQSLSSKHLIRDCGHFNPESVLGPGPYMIK